MSCLFGAGFMFCVERIETFVWGKRLAIQELLAKNHQPNTPIGTQKVTPWRIQRARDFVKST